MHFGLVQLKERGWSFYVTGYKNSDEISNQGDWWPNDRYAKSSVLQKINTLIDAGSLGERWTAEIVLVQGYGCLLTKALAPYVQATLGDVQISTGFDEGDLLIFTNGEFVNT